MTFISKGMADVHIPSCRRRTWCCSGGRTLPWKRHKSHPRSWVANRGPRFPHFKDLPPPPLPPPPPHLPSHHQAATMGDQEWEAQRGGTRISVEISATERPRRRRTATSTPQQVKKNRRPVWCCWNRLCMWLTARWLLSVCARTGRGRDCYCCCCCCCVAENTQKTHNAAPAV